MPPCRDPADLGRRSGSIASTRSGFPADPRRRSGSSDSTRSGFPAVAATHGGPSSVIGTAPSAVAVGTAPAAAPPGLLQQVHGDDHVQCRVPQELQALQVCVEGGEKERKCGKPSQGGTPAGWRQKQGTRYAMLKPGRGGLSPPLLSPPHRGGLSPPLLSPPHRGGLSPPLLSPPRTHLVAWPHTV